MRADPRGEGFQEGGAGITRRKDKEIGAGPDMHVPRPLHPDPFRTLPQTGETFVPICTARHGLRERRAAGRYS